MKPRFKVGDRVRVIDAKSLARPDYLGKVGVVVGVTQYDVGLSSAVSNLKVDFRENGFPYTIQQGFEDQFVLAKNGIERAQEKLK